ncbi:hypothetical protein GE061_019158 [Apolygus lucorum]|uniref:Vps41 beta-propeller domain-containing protein n=1 Tax=Apolygus lucorum TaxID=248454 RepID=A0A6A4JJM1_APOLU|nr:hypothetical protein GE061_019158 [Apolygus lucorum]
METSQCEKPDKGGVDDDEEREHILKYSQLGINLKDILKVDSITSVAMHSKFICIGTEMGVIYILDHLGNIIRELRIHDIAVEQLSIDGNGDHIASCFNDGRVLVTGLCDSLNNQDFKLEKRVRSVAIDPNYYKAHSGRKLIIGERKLILREKIAFSRWKKSVLEDATSECGVKTIRWSPTGNLVLWASHRWLRIYDLETKATAALCEFSMETKIDLKCHVCWKGGQRVTVGWGDRIEVLSVQKKVSPSKLIVKSVFSTSMKSIVCGVGPLDEFIAVCGYGNGINDVTVGELPYMKVIHSDPEEYTYFGTDILSLSASENYVAAQYSLDCIADEGIIVIVCPKDVLLAQLSDIDDRIDWLLKHRKYQLAMDVMQQSKVPPIRHTKIKVSVAFMDDLLESGNYDEAVALCRGVINDINENDMWKQILTKFGSVNRLRAIADFLPCGWVSPLTDDCYHAVLNEYLRMNHEGFLKKIKTWHHHLYNKQFIADSIWKQILNADDKKTNPILLEALAIIYSHMKQYDESFVLYARLQSKYAFELLKEHNLYWTIHKSAKDLMKMDSSQAVEAMLWSSEANPQLIVNHLEKEDYYLYLYLDALYLRKPKLSEKFHTVLMRLYAEFERKKLMGLLRNSDLYAINQALKVCKQRNFIEEKVYLLGRIGNTKRALQLIFSEINDFDRAIDFCKEHDDEELWEDVINFALDKPRYINMLLKRIGTHVDPRVVIQKIDEKLEIPMLRDALVKMMQDYLLNVRIQENFKEIVSCDHHDLHNRQLMTRKRAIAIRCDIECGACSHPLLVENLKDGEIPSELTIFNCSHAFHSHCLPVEAYCTKCTRKPTLK